MQFMKNKKTFSIGRLLLYIIKAPLYLLSGIRNWLLRLIKSIKFSIRRKITFNYLFLYTIVALFTLVFMMGGILKAELDEKSFRVYTYVDSTIDKYENDIYDSEDVKEKIEAISEIENCRIWLSSSTGNISPITGGGNESYEYPTHLISKLSTFLNLKMYSKEMPIYYSSQSEGEDHFILQLMLPIAPYEKSILSLAIILAFCLLFGFFVLWIFGSINSKRVLMPIFTITKTAERISIKNMNERLDVEQAKYELRDLAITFNEMLNRINYDYEKQKRFVSDVSHELRTPISIVNGYAEMLKRWGKDDEAVLEESIDAIIGEAKNMQILVENLLTLVRADNQTLLFHKEEFMINRLMEEIVSESEMINCKRQQFICSGSGEIRVNLDIQMIKQALRILVDNAVKYTSEEGSIFISYEAYDNSCFIYIKDTGIGISKEDLPFIFDRFYRSDESRTRETGGHGLGLSIAKAIILGHEGKIKVKSKRNEGAEFTVILPLAELSSR